MEKQEKAVAAALWREGGSEREELSFAELYSLAATAGVEVVAGFTQNRSQIDNRYFIGPGKAEEIGNFIRDEKIDTVIFDGELSPSQVKNLERLIPAKVVDRSELILDIFSQRASSKEGQLQVELAQLRYQLPKLMGKGRDLSRLAGGIGTRGPGETKLEVDRRQIRQRIHVLEQDLKQVEKHRALLRKRRERRGVFQVALVGYTNSGKSTLLNQLTKAEAYTADILFATLDPLSRRLESEHNTILLTDTVGFISGLPHHLIAAFKSTLEVVVNADLLVHVVDISHPDMAMQIKEVNKVLKELGAIEKDQIIAANKSDLVPDLSSRELASLFRGIPYVPISALTGFNTDKLLTAILAYTEPWETVRLLLPMHIFSRLSSADQGKLLPLEFTSDNQVKVEAELPAGIAATLVQYKITE
jgi:GTP-binding protein HflX